MPSSTSPPLPQEDEGPLLPSSLLSLADPAWKEVLLQVLEGLPMGDEPPAMRPPGHDPYIPSFLSNSSSPFQKKTRQEVLQEARGKVDALYRTGAFREIEVRRGLLTIPSSTSLPYALRGIHALEALRRGFFPASSPVEQEDALRLYPSLFLSPSLTCPQERQEQARLLRGVFRGLYASSVEGEVGGYAPAVQEVLMHAQAWRGHKNAPTRPSADALRLRCLSSLLTCLETPLLRTILLRHGPSLLEDPRGEVALPLLLALDLQVLLKALPSLENLREGRVLGAYALLEQVTFLPTEGAAPLLRALLQGEVPSLEDAFAYCASWERFQGMPSSWWAPLLPAFVESSSEASSSQPSPLVIF